MYDSPMTLGMLCSIIGFLLTFVLLWFLCDEFLSRSPLQRAMFLMISAFTSAFLWSWLMPVIGTRALG